MSAPLADGSMNSNAAQKIASYTTTALKRWSCYSPRELPPVLQVKALHVYDFDNTLFMSPLPNRKLWTGETVGWLQNQEELVNGGWWHDERILEATGEGVEKEEQRAWDGWWNENLVDLVRLSMKQDDTLTVLLTGRSETNFTEVIRRIVTSKQLLFDMICLKPQAGPNNQKFASTMKYKQAILADMVHTYKDAGEIRVYEDRPKHTQGFREYFQSLNDQLVSPNTPTPRKPIKAEIIQVADTLTTLDSVVETSEVQRMINDHNIAIRTENPMHLLPWEIKRQVFFTGYLLSQKDGAILIEVLNRSHRLPETGISYLANSILIFPRPPHPGILKKVGGWGFKQKWQVTGIGHFDNKIWAARVAPVPANSSIHTETPVPLIVLAMTRNARPVDANKIQNWLTVSTANAPIFDTTVGEKVQLRIERHSEADNDGDNPTHNGVKRTYQCFRPNRGGYNNDENRRPSGPGNFRGGNQNRGRGGGGGNGPQGGGNRGRGRGGSGGGNRGGSMRGRGRGGYRSLDDIGPGNDRYASQGRNQHQNHNDGSGYGDGYKSKFPPLGGDGAGDGGLSY